MADEWGQFKEAPKSWDEFKPAEAKAPESSIGRTLGLKARNAIQGLTGIPQMVMNAEGGLVNAGLDLFQGYHAPDEPNGPFRYRSAGANIGQALTNAGLPAPATGEERLAGDVEQGLWGAGSGQAIPKLLQRAAAPVTQAIGRTLAANPAKQIIGGGTGGLAAGGAREAGAPLPVQMAAGVAGGFAPFAGGIPRAMVRGGPMTAPEQRAMQAGYTLPPATMEKPSILSKMLGGWSGKIKSQQGASTKNQALAKQTAASSLGLPRDTVLDDNVFSALRQQEGRAYETVKRAVPTITTDNVFGARVGGLGSMNSDLAQHFPELVKNDAIMDLAVNLSKKSSFPTSAGIEAVKTLRFNATKNMQAIGDPEKNALGLAQREAADALDDLMDRNISNAGSPGVVAAYRAARQKIARSHDVESATNTSTGEIDPRRLALLSDKGRPLGGGLEGIADVARAFPKAMQMPSKFGGAEPLSVLDMLAAGGALGTGAMTGNLGSGAALAGATLSRPLVRQLTLSPAYQRAMQSTAPMGAANMALPQAAIQSNILRNNQ